MGSAFHVIPCAESRKVQANANVPKIVRSLPGSATSRRQATTIHRVQATGFELKITSYKLQAAGRKLQATSDRLQAIGYKQQATSYRLQASCLGYSPRIISNI